MPTVLVTGGTGHIGRHLVPMLREGDAEVVLLGRSESCDLRADLADPTSLDAHVGYLWWGIREQHGIRVAMLYFIGIFEPYRRRGYATQTLRLLEEQVRGAGLDDIRLYVFGHNTRAWALYEKMGYEVVSTTMGKRIEL